MYKDIVLSALLGKVDDSALAQACMLADASQGSVTTLVAASYLMPATAAWTFYRPGTYPDLDSVGAAALQHYVDDAEKHLANTPVKHSVRGVAEFWMTASEICVSNSLLADLIVLGVARPIEEDQQKLFAGTLTGSGRPILVVPTNASARRLRHVLIAWKNSREAAHALRDAMPILQGASVVEIVQVGESEIDPSTPGVSAANLVEHLRLHGVTARAVHLARTEAETGWTIADYALTSGADLIVAGGYGHPRAMEYVFGGVTLYLLKYAQIPVLFSH